jgi:5-methylthioadenosine/S-adenosylhomocysteine deaminase
MKEIDTLIIGGRVLLMDEKDTILPEGAVAIDGERIEAVGPLEQIRNRYSGRVEIDARDSLVMPGLVNGHTHAAMTCFRGIADDMELMQWLNRYIFPAEARNVDPELVFWGSLLACAEMIRSGTTTFCDMYIFEEQTARAAKEAGMRCLVGEVLFDFPSPNFKTPAEGLAYTRGLLERWSGDPLVRIVVEPHALYTCSPSLLIASKALADEFQAPYATHLLENRSEAIQLREKLGKPALNFLEEIGWLTDRFIAFHCVCMEEEDIRRFADHGCRAIHNPESNMKLASGIAPVSAMRIQGIPMGLGTDGCASNNDLDLLREMDTAGEGRRARPNDPSRTGCPEDGDVRRCQGPRAGAGNGLAAAGEEGGYHHHRPQRAAPDAALQRIFPSGLCGQRRRCGYGPHQWTGRHARPVSGYDRRGGGDAARAVDSGTRKEKPGKRIAVSVNDPD